MNAANPAQNIIDGDDRSVILVQVYRKHRVRKPELVGCHSDTISEVVRKSKHGVLEATLRKDTPDGLVLSGITIRFALAAKPCGKANAEGDEVTDPAKMVNTTMHETMLEALSRRMEVFMRISISNAEVFQVDVQYLDPTVLVGRKNRDDRIIRLVALMCTVFVSVENAEPLKGTGPYMETLALLIQQVAECGYFITEYANTEAAIRRIVQWTIRQLPRVLINTSTGHLYNRSKQTSAFESLPIFNELVLSMKTHIDYVRIKHEVRYYFRYVMLSHKWEENEPLFQQVIHMACLRAFCEIVRKAGFNWAWSDTCCIDKSDHFVLQEALVAMFKWYQGSAITIVFLRGVRSSSQLGALVKSIWNTRTWTLQEYIAAKVIHFYTEDWTPYLNLELLNHKESPKVISEMEEATGVSADQLMSLRPGLTSIREKLCLASTRQTTLVEDAAYSLLGIFSVTGLPAIYGEGEDSLGRLLAHVLTGSGDASILAWTGESGSFNSCLPANITVFDGPASSHLPPPLPDVKMEILAASHTSSFDIDVALTLYNRLNELPAPWFAASRMKLPCIAFQLPPLSPYRTRSGHVYRADTLTFGMVKIKTRHDLTRMHSLYLVHPWLDTLLEREGKSGGIVGEDVAPPPSLSMDGEESLSNEIGEEEIPVEEDDDSLALPGREPRPSPAPMHLVQMDRETRARRLVARLRQPFGAVLLALASTGGRAVDYRRVAADSLVTVQFQENVLLSDILDNVRTLDVLYDPGIQISLKQEKRDNGI
ncbi:hypothetical protein EV363DRAFT_1399401 [Boletus edulis]|nr:hypothetical protein EV363DRAFT_1399401 [Boletus edulis]